MTKKPAGTRSRRAAAAGPAARRGGGGATAGGVTYQARVAAWFGVAVLANEHAAGLPGLPAGAVPEEIWCETTEALDDLGVPTSAGVRLQVQAKRTLSLTTSPTGEFAKVCAQLVDAAAGGDPGDVLLLVVGLGAGMPVTRDLRELLDALRTQPVTGALPPRPALAGQGRCAGHAPGPPAARLAREARRRAHDGRPARAPAPHPRPRAGH